MSGQDESSSSETSIGGQFGISPTDKGQGALANIQLFTDNVITSQIFIV